MADWYNERKIWQINNCFSFAQTQREQLSFVSSSFFHYTENVWSYSKILNGTFIISGQVKVRTDSLDQILIKKSLIELIGVFLSAFKSSYVSSLRLLVVKAEKRLPNNSYVRVNSITLRSWMWARKGEGGISAKNQLHWSVCHLTAHTRHNPTRICTRGWMYRYPISCRKVTGKMCSSPTHLITLFRVTTKAKKGFLLRSQQRSSFRRIKEWNSSMEFNSSTIIYGSLMRICG